MVLLAVVYVVGMLFNSQIVYFRTTQRPLLPDFSPSLVSRVELTGANGQTILLKKSETGWAVLTRGRGLPASAVKIQTFLASLANLKRGKLANSDPALDSEFDLGAHQRRGVKVFGTHGTVVADLLVGKRGASGYEDYIRLRKGHRVFLTRSSLSFYLAQDRAYWYDLFVLPGSATESTITEIEVSGDIPLDSTGRTFRHETYDLVLDDSERTARWTLRGRSSKLDQRKTQLMSHRLAVLQGVDFRLTTEKGAHGHVLNVTVVMGSKKKFSLRGRPTSTGTQYQVTTSGLPYVYVVNTAALVRAVVPLSSLIER